MTDAPYHHGRLRATLLAEAEQTLRERGIDALSLRDLARQAGVSHAAPRRHFEDRRKAMPLTDLEPPSTLPRGQLRGRLPRPGCGTVV